MRLNELAHKVNVSVKHIWSILNNKSRPSPELAKELERVTGVTRLAWLYPDEFHNPYIKKIPKTKRKRARDNK